VSRVWFTSDHHFGHENILSYAKRPFGSVDEMNRTMIEKHNDVVGDSDTVWILGDVALGNIKDTLPLVGQLRGHKYLVAGNHDRCFAGSQPDKARRERWVEAYCEQGGFIGIVTGSGWANTAPKFRRPIILPRVGGAFGPPVILSHFPYAKSSRPDPEDRFATYRPVPPKKDPKNPDVPVPWLLHGHVHTEWCVNGDMINVGVDAWGFAPVEAEVIAALIEGGPQ
jgi:calcineurin-like phosphoesterase family protein